MAVYDTFVLFNELDLLEIRLRTLSPVVDRFVIVEANTTYGGNPKPFYFFENSKRFEPFMDKIFAIHLDDMPTGIERASHWQREYHQRNAILRGLVNAKSDDVILISDVDEIPRPEKIPQHLDDALVLIYDQVFYYYNFNTRARQAWFGTRALRYDTLCALPMPDLPHLGHMNGFGGGVQSARYLGKFWGEHSPLGIIFNGGWHFSHFGGVEVIRNKLLNGAHQEVNRKEWTDPEAIAQRVAERRDLFDREEMQFELIPDNADLPVCVLEDRERYTMHFAESEVLA